MTEALAKLTSPAGDVVYVCHAAPGHTPNASAAIRFASDRAAWRAANAAIYGSPDAFWNSERASAAATRERMRGWTASIESAP